MKPLLFALTLTSTLISRTSALCQMARDPAPTGQPITDQNLCQPQGVGFYTFGVVIDLTTLGLPGSTVGSNSFYVMDTNCTLLGSYDRPPDCSTPWGIHDSFLLDDIVVTDVFLDVGDPPLTFNHAGELHKIGDLGCACGNTPGVGFPAASQSCRCPFPVEGQARRRSVDFEA